MTPDRSIRFPVLFLFTVSCAFVLGEQHFLETPQPYQEVSAGDDVRLRCIVQDKGGECMWWKDRMPLARSPNKYEWENDSDGDCTLLIKRATLNFDDGFWQCSVIFSDFTRQDALSSNLSRLLIRVKPREPQLKSVGAPLGTTLTLKEGQEVTISCVSRYGNPPAFIKWFIGNKEVEPVAAQSNATEVGNPKTWAVHSLLRVRGQRENHGLPIRCVTMHPTSSAPISAETRLNVHYLPEVRIETNPQPLAVTPEDMVSFLNLRCLADANPAPSIEWYKDSMPLSASSIDTVFSPSSLPKQGKTMLLNGTVRPVWVSELSFEPVTRSHAGLYSCKATNDVNESVPASYRFDVQYL